MKINMRFIRYNLLVLLMILLLSLTFKPLFNNINYGLDLQGGFEVLYQLKSIDGTKLTSEMVTNTYKTVQKRIDVLGVSEPDIIIEGKNRIRVKLAGITNKDEAREILSKTASLTFRDTDDNLLMTSSVLGSGLAKLSYDKYGKPAVLLTIADKEKFYRVTDEVKDYQDNRIVIWLDYEEGIDSYTKEANNCGSLGSSKCLSAATVDQAFASNVIIQGNFSKEEATNLVELINSGSLPTKMEEISSRSVDSVFGEQALDKTLFAGIIGIILIALFMTLAYRFAGFISSVGIMIYTLLVFVVFYLIGGVLTLPGIASLVLGIGMAVDACVLSFERIKEELWRGKSLTYAFEHGYKRSFSTIFDSNITTLIVAIILFYFGESSVKGFATMLIISIFITIIVMVYVVKYILRLYIKTKYFDKKLSLFINVKAKDVYNIEVGEKNPKLKPFTWLDFLKRRKLLMGLSSLIIIVGIMFTIFTPLNLSVDYKGGSEITLSTTKSITSKELKADIKALGYDYNTVDTLNDGTTYIKIDNILSKEEVKTVSSYFKTKYNAETEIGVVSNIVKKELTINALISVLISLIGIIIYVSLRFKFNYAIAGIIALFHDVLIVMAIFSIFNFEISVIFIAALLTIIGYSINDTVVVFDRIRETIKNKYGEKPMTKENLYGVVNDSLRGTLVRSLYTTITVILAVISLLIFGTHSIVNFNLAMLFGLISGAYSSIYLASPVWYEIEKKYLGSNKKKTKKSNLDDELDELEVKGINK